MNDDDVNAERATGPGTKRNDAKPAIVGIGASAGGLAALKRFFEALPADTGAAFVVVVHLDPQGPSELAGILAASTRMPVAPVGASEKLQANRVYVIPPDRQLAISDHEISAKPFDAPRGHRAPIDLFFRSLASQHGDAFAIILTGAGSDGALGVRAVKETGGIILVQDPDEAEHSSMPRSAIATGSVDFVLPVQELAGRLADLLAHRDSVSPIDDQVADEDLLRRVIAHVRVRTGHDFSQYKRSTVLRRLARRIQVTRAANISAYYDLLRDNAEEVKALFGDLLISVTTFFRDADAFDVLRAQVLPQLFVGKEPSDSVRVWVPGCATGEEVYTIAILLLEEAARHDIRPTLQVFGTDLDAHALAIARDGLYPAAIETDVGEERLRRYFAREGDHYRVRRELRDHVLFASHSLLKDPPFSRIDLISCRNLLIYLDRTLQQQACSTFHYALNPGGYLLLGSSETADTPPDLFRSVDRKARIYQSTSHPGDKPRLLPRLLGGIGRDLHQPLGRPLNPAVALSEAASHRRALEKLAPPSILVDPLHRVLHLSESAGRYLQPAGGPLSGDIVDLVRPELRLELRTALNRVFEHRQSSLSLPIPVRFNGKPHRVHLQIRPIEEEHGKSRSGLILFIEGEPIEAPEASADQQQVNDVTVRRVTAELQLTQERLRTTREESEAANEELRAANEELQSMNEEYRSTSEELETSREELQSINEELQTVNAELKLKLDAVSRAHGDLQNLMAATDFGTLFLDSALRIKRFTERVTDLFPISANDEGRPVADFAHLLEYNDLVQDARRVLAEFAPVRREARSRSGRWYDVRLRPYRTVDNRIDGVVITFVDITERLQTERALRDSEQKLRQERRLVENSHDPIFMWDLDRGIVEWNRGCTELYGFTREEALGRKKQELLGTTVLGSSFDELVQKLLREGSWSGELAQRTKDGRNLTVESRIVLETIDGRHVALESTRDITERKLWERRQQLLLGELTHRVKNTLAVVQAISHQTLRTSVSGEEFVERLDGRLAALASAHGLLVESDWKGADFAALARSQLEPYIVEHRERVWMEGPPISLPAELATPFGLVLHELATNAAKYGSLAVRGGIVRLRWTVTERNRKPLFTVVWSETGGPPVSTPTAFGFGSTLIEKGIPNAKVSRAYPTEGMRCTIEVPIPSDAEPVASLFGQ